MTPAQTVPNPPTPPAAPEPAAAPAIPNIALPTTSELAAPRTAAQVAGLRARSLELQSQLRDAQHRRSDVARELRHADVFSRGPLEMQLNTLDEHVLQLQSDAAITDRLVTSAPPALVAATAQPPRRFLIVGPNGPSANAVPVLLLLIIVLQVLAFVRARGRRVGPGSPDPVLRDAAARLVRLEQAVDAIAIEVERVSEGQRFVTRALAESADRAITSRAEH